MMEQSDESTKIRVTERLGQNLKQFRESIFKMTQTEFGKMLGCEQETISKWETGTLLPRLADIAKIADEAIKIKTPKWDIARLLSLEPVEEYNGIEWLARIPDYCSPEQRQKIVQGIETFKLLLYGTSVSDCTSKLRVDWKTLNSWLSFALRTRSLQILKVQHDEDKELELMRHYDGLRNVIVAKTPRLGPDKYTDGTDLRIELVSFLAATQALASVAADNPNVGIGHGWTMYRFAQNSAMCPRIFGESTMWIPMMARDDADFERSVYSANSVASLMALHHQGKSLHFPFVPLEKRAELTEAAWSELLAVDQKTSSAVTRFHQVATTYFITVGRENPDSTLPVEPSTVRLKQSINHVLWERGLIGELAGDVLGIHVNHKGEVIDNAVQQINEKQVFTIGLDKLRLRTKVNPTWVIAANRHKQGPVLMALRSGYANSLVIDEEIADYLIQNAA